MSSVNLTIADDDINLTIGETIVIQQSGSGGIYQLLTFAPSNSYTLTAAPSNPANVRLYINGLKARHSVDFNINGTILNYVGTDFALKATDLIEVYY